jgi:hypothetical protein
MTAVREIDFDLSGLGLRLRGLPEGLGSRLAEHWARFRVERCAEIFLDAEVSISGAPMAPAGTVSRELSAREGPFGATFELPEGTLELIRSHARVRLAPGDEGRQYWGLVNLLAIAFGWLLPAHGGATLHAAGIVVDGRAFLLLGAEGEGKTTWTGLAEEAGASVLSDDIVVVDASSEPVTVRSAPFRADDFRPVGPGRWPVAALLVPRHGEEPALAPLARLPLAARLTASLFSVATSEAAEGRRGAVVERLIESVPARTLTFPKDGSFLALLRSFPARRG